MTDIYSQQFRIILLALATQYVVYVLVDSDLFRGIRNRLSGVPLAGQILTCYNCCSFWAALFVLAVDLSPYTGWFVWVLALASASQLLYQVREKTVP